MINVGDLVQVVRGMPCCGHATGAEGMIFVVYSIKDCSGEYCVFCNALLPPVTAHGCPGRRGINIPRLRLIPRLWELDETEYKEELSA
jgi:hypothetical protein